MNENHDTHVREYVFVFKCSECVNELETIFEVPTITVTELLKVKRERQ